MRKLVVCASLACFASVAGAQQSARPDPADPSARAPKPAYESVFAGYRPWAEADLARWREVNDEVSRLAGHPGHAGRAKPAPKPQAAAAEARK